MVSSLFSESALFKTREGRAGKVHNFMLGLNLNNDVPLFPFNETASPMEDEVDAVTGKSLCLLWSFKFTELSSSVALFLVLI